MGTEETGRSDQQHENVVSTDQITSGINQSATQLPVTNSSDAHPANNIAGGENPPIVVVSLVVEESSHWDFDMSSHQLNDSNNIDKDSSVTTKAEENVASSMDPNVARSPSVASSSPSIWDVPSPENNIIFPESGNLGLICNYSTSSKLRTTWVSDMGKFRKTLQILLKYVTHYF